MAVDYTPTLGDYKELKPFRYWCQKVLPLVYDDSLSYYELLCKVVDYLNKTMEDVDTLHDDVDALHDAYVQLQTYVNNYFDSLDVQTEINNKLDEMAEDGSLSDLIEPFLPDIISAWLSEHITPTTPTIDNTLTVSGAGADSKTVGDRLKGKLEVYTPLIQASNYETLLPDVDNIAENVVYHLNTVANESTIPAHLPFTNAPKSGIYTLITYANIGQSNIGATQILIGDRASDEMWIRGRGNAWSNWINLLSDKTRVYTPLVQASNYQSILPDVDNISSNIVYHLNLVMNETTIPAHLPFDKPPIGGIYTLMTHANIGQNNIGATQLLYCSSSGDVWIRGRGVSSWSDWKNVVDSIAVKNALDAKISVYTPLVQSNNYATILPDVDNITENIVYHLNLVANETNIPAHLPFTTVPMGSIYTLITYANKSQGNVGATQVLFSSDTGKTWYRGRGVNAWTDWRSREDFMLVVGANDNLVSAINKANNLKQCSVLVKGTHNILTELETVYPNFFTNYSASQLHGRGLEIGNGCTYVFEPDSMIVCNYTGDNTSFIQNFSPFMLGNSDCEIVGLNIQASNVRYGIHDDPIQKTNHHKHIYRRCNVYVDNSNSGQVFKACIGGGLPVSAEIIIEDCVFESIGIENTRGTVSYHNSSVANAKSNVIIKNNYFKTSTYKCTYYGPSTLVTNNLVSGNRLRYAPIVSQESSDYSNVNMALLAWNNTIEA